MEMLKSIRNLAGIIGVSVLLAGCSEPGNMAEGYRASSTQQSITDTNLFSLEGSIIDSKQSFIPVGQGQNRFPFPITFVYFRADDSSEHTIIWPYAALFPQRKRASIQFYRTNGGTITSGEFREKFVIKGTDYDSSISDNFILEANGVFAPKGIKILGVK